MKLLKLLFIIIFVLIVFVLIIIFFFVKFVKFDIAMQKRLNKLFLKHSTNDSILDCENIEWSKTLREHHKEIHQEYKDFVKKYHSPALFKKQIDKNGEIDINEKWKSIILYVYGKETEYAKYFPKTMKLLKKTPSTLAMFSVMESGAVLVPHKGVYSGILRYHLGLKVPKDYKNCMIGIKDKSGKETIMNWEEGKDMYFDDMYTHWVKNNTDESRVILFVDIKKKFRNFFVNLLNNIIMYVFKHNYNKDFELNKNVDAINNILKENINDKS